MILFAEVAETASFTGAAERLGIPKSTASQRISQLEDRLGLRLLNRTTRKVTLTGSGQVYLEFCNRVRSEARDAERALTHLKEQTLGHLKITCPDVTAAYLMPGFLHEFARRFPMVTVELLATNQSLDLIAESIDFAFRVGPSDNQSLVQRRIASIRRSVTATPGYLSSSEQINTPQDLVRHRCLIHTGQPLWRFAKAQQEYNLSPSPAMSSDSIAFLVQACAMGEGVALLPRYVVKPFLERGQLVEVLTRFTTSSNEMFRGGSGKLNR